MVCRADRRFVERLDLPAAGETGAPMRKILITGGIRGIYAIAGTLGACGAYALRRHDVTSAIWPAHRGGKRSATL
jgi:hypothetical protein